MISKCFHACCHGVDETNLSVLTGVRAVVSPGETDLTKLHAAFFFKSGSGNFVSAGTRELSYFEVSECVTRAVSE